MVILETRDGTKRGPRFLADLRNNLLFIYDTDDDEWYEVKLKPGFNKFDSIKQGEPLQVKDLNDLYSDLIVVSCTQRYNGPHPAGAVPCHCGAVRDLDGWCPRCNDQKCHRCGKQLNEKGLCTNPVHNPLQVPHERESWPLAIEETQEWEKKVDVPHGTRKRRKKDA